MRGTASGGPRSFSWLPTFFSGNRSRPARTRTPSTSLPSQRHSLSWRGSRPATRHAATGWASGRAARIMLKLRSRVVGARRASDRPWASDHVDLPLEVARQARAPCAQVGSCPRAGGLVRHAHHRDALKARLVTIVPRAHGLDQRRPRSAPFCASRARLVRVEQGFDMIVGRSVGVVRSAQGRTG